MLDKMTREKWGIPDFSNVPAVALETTIISHGMPYPENVKTALAVEEEVRKAGAVPVTIGIVDGKIRIGMTHEEIEEFGKRHDIMKCSRSDIAYCLANKKSGATTVAATMILAEMAGIKVFATGGLGGVHRNAQKTFDISADLNEFARTPVTVICSGPKAILDISLTLEYLETQGVPVIGYNTDTLPMFYSRSSNYSLEMKATSPDFVAQIMKTSNELELKQGMIVANPIPEEYSLPNDEIEKTIEEAICEMDKKGISGKAVTPYLLSKIVELTKGKSLESNIALIKNNAKLAGEIAVKYNEKK